MDRRANILIVDDDPDIRQVLTLLLKDRYNVTPAPSGLAALAHMREHTDTDLVILDVMMPGMDGIETCREIRKLSNVPVLFLTAKSTDGDKVDAYGSGGDDFLSKPFSHAELQAKVFSLLRRYTEYRGKDETLLTAGDFEFDPVGRCATVGGKPVQFTETESSILDYLMHNRGRTVTAKELYEAVWGLKYLQGSNNNIMVHVLNLRRKIEADPASPKILRTVWGKGYQID